MLTIALLSQKGGTGKTTLACALAVAGELRSRDSIDTDRHPVHRHQAVVPANHVERIVERVHRAVNHSPVHLDDDSTRFIGPLARYF